MDERRPRCPLCGARSRWLYFAELPRHLHNTIPDECHWCRWEALVHWRNQARGIDVVEYGGGPLGDGNWLTTATLDRLLSEL